ncbi:MAG: hypothetical protein A3J74_05695 [Elusimicrobia bacterium RIFCSPHIGHO2_02_FULL_57_9]|nr:MAG: hypothetical protein A3J74_05695 [Elusimicrobia bacterium RIFCSPHIGHO2_02_FULL_57_9]
MAPGDSIHSKRWIDFFAQRGHDVHWASLENFTTHSDHAIRTYAIAPVKPEAYQVIKGALALKYLLKKMRPDILHVHSAGRNGVTALLSGFHPRIVTAWGSEILVAGKSKILGMLIKKVLQSSDLITCDAEHMRQAVTKMGIKDDKVRVVYFGTDTARFKPRAKSTERRRELGVQDESLVISLRSLEPIYNIEMLLRAAQIILKHNPKVVFIIAGTGSEKEKLVQLAESLNIADKVRFVGQIQNQLLPEYLTTSDIYVSTSQSDAGLAASTAEAMSCALPVVVTDSGENRLWIEGNKGGFIVPVEDAEALAERVIFLLKNPDAGYRFGQFNRALIEKRNNYYSEMLKIEEIYASMLR